MKKKQLTILIPAVLILGVGIRAVKKGKNPRRQAYQFTVNDYEEAHSLKRSTRRPSEKAYILNNLLNNPQMYQQFPLAQNKGQMFMDSSGKHIVPENKKKIVARADLIHSKGSVKDFYKLKNNPYRFERSKVLCLPRSRAREVPSGNFSYKFTTKAAGTKYGTMYYTCYVDTGSAKIKKLFESLPGKEIRGIKVIGSK